MQQEGALSSWFLLIVYGGFLFVFLREGKILLSQRAKANKHFHHQAATNTDCSLFDRLCKERENIYIFQAAA
jgi:hypothetical protein